MGLQADEVLMKPGLLARTKVRFDSTLKRLITKGLLAVASGFALILILLSPIGELLESTLALHMVVDHNLFMICGILLTYGFDTLLLADSKVSSAAAGCYRTLLSVNARYNKRGLLGVGVAAALAIYWHLPGNFDAAVLNESIHLQMHLSFVLVGSLLFLGYKLLTRKMRGWLIVGVCKPMEIFGAYLLVTPTILYTVYPAADQAIAGAAMVFMCLAVDATIFTNWLCTMFAR